MTQDRFLVFIRSGKDPWHHIASTESLGLAIAEADSQMTLREGAADRAVVMEVGSVDAMPMFTFKYRAKR